MSRHSLGHVPADDDTNRPIEPIEPVDLIDVLALTAAVEAIGMRVRGAVSVSDLEPGDRAMLPKVDGRDASSLVVIGNVGGEMWPHFRRDDPHGRPDDNALDRWTRALLAPIAERFGAVYLHPSDEPFWPVQRWAIAADVVERSPIGLLIHPDFGLWHAYRGIFVVADDVSRKVPGTMRDGGGACVACVGQPCL